MEAFVAYCDPSVEWRPPLSASFGGTVYYGHEGLRQWLRDTEEVWGNEIRAQTEFYFDLGEHTLSFDIARARKAQRG